MVILRLIFAVPIDTGIPMHVKNKKYFCNISLSVDSNGSRYVPCFVIGMSKPEADGVYYFANVLTKANDLVSVLTKKKCKLARYNRWCCKDSCDFANLLRTKTCFLLLRYIRLFTLYILFFILYIYI